MKRSDEAPLRAWLDSSRRKPLVVRGARQVGKSTLVRQLARAAGLPLWEVNLEQHAALDPVFAGLDPPTILRERLVLDEIRRWAPPSPFSPAAHERLLGLLREYLVVGGMPEAVARYAEGRDLVTAAAVHRSILGTYVDDFSKYARGADLERL